jgi:hypothetical protein
MSFGASDFEWIIMMKRISSNFISAFSSNCKNQHWFDRETPAPYHKLISSLSTSMVSANI